MKIVSVRFLLLVFSFFLSCYSFAREIRVCASGCGFNSLQVAVNAASRGDSILVDINGSLTESRIIISKDITIRGLGITSTVIQANARRGTALHRVFYITGGAIVVLEDLTIQNGRETSDYTNWNGSGGGILIDGVFTSVRLKNVAVKHCDNTSRLGNGAGITLAGNATTLYLDNCLLDNNISNYGGAGGLYLTASSGDCFIQNTIFKNNIAANGNGGAALADANMAITFIGCSFTANQALNGYNGGAVYSGNTTLTFNNCVFSYNKAEKEGGAMKIGGADIGNCSFFYNTAFNGGAISRNTASPDQDLYLANCTLLNNAATGYGPAGAGLHNASPTALVHMVNTVIDKSTTGTDLYMYAASTLSTNEKNHVGRAKFTTGSARFVSN